ncbi:MAG: hypothetical protein A3F84_07115 [Candidatus Handelsmanbacteria bacterium RIFCSPLOWO2_12_FULL_64_10]|uniref:Uncharacterized protein n=1 Tax=Handelsmanbacteria sp. (strain RIFCSPLOWO2_12_FULL_64_10) TaxID=1817868 RepID=A0A1F6C5X4_HANXR|nr:MAG: hypothetical protein A3F84_07115 [Candidatus Handelsmanbacteria bacterium RIFCSPLOWO2_12_FULL_64_10]
MIDLAHFACYVSEHKPKYREQDYDLNHGLLDLIPLVLNWLEKGVQDSPELDYVLRFWKESVLVENGVCPAGSIGSEVLIQGAVRYERGDVS